jgi:hypothetical protein
MSSQSLTGFSPRRSGFAPRAVHVEFVVDKVVLGQVFMQVLQFSLVNIIPPMLHVSCIIWGWTMGILTAAVPETQFHPIEKKKLKCLLASYSCF